MLNKEQKEAIKDITNPLLVIAGPGTGKTTVITEKIAYLIEKGYKPEEILAVTFTQKAAEEMSSRIKLKTNKDFNAKTFHSFALELIEEYQGEISEIDQDFQLIDESLQLVFFLDNINSFKLESIDVKNNQRAVSYEIFSSIIRLKEYGVSLDNFGEVDFHDPINKEDLRRSFEAYELYKLQNNFLDFGDLLLLTTKLLRNKAVVREDIKSKFKYILVDEFQDTNKLQYELLKLIVNKNNFTLVGDKKQSIYSFRGASIENFNLLKKDFPNCRELYLIHNYRSAKKIVKTFNSLTAKISSNKEILKCVSDEEGEVGLYCCKTQDSQLTLILEAIRNFFEKTPQGKVGILTRKNYELEKISSYLKKFDVDHYVSKSEKFLDYDIIREILLILDVIDRPYEANQEIFSLLEFLPLRKETIRNISKKASLNEKSIFVSLNKSEEISEYLGEKEIVESFLKKIKLLIDLNNSNLPLKELVTRIVKDFSIYKKALSSRSENNIYALKAFLSYFENYCSIQKEISISHFLRVTRLSKGFSLEDTDISDSDIQLLSIHQSKGKEFDLVILPNLNDRHFPSNYKTSQFKCEYSSLRDAFLDEEQRLFFVALSRAKNTLQLSYVKKFENNKYESKISNLVSILGLREIEFNEEKFGLKLSRAEEIKVRHVKRIRDLLYDNKYDQAIREVQFLKRVFATRKDLTHFLLNKGDIINMEELEEEITINSKSHVYSSTQIKTYETCPKKYQYSYVYKIPTESKYYFDFGTSLHSVLEFLVPLMKKEKDKFVLFTKATSKLLEVWIATSYKSSEQESEYLKRALDIIKKFIDTQLELFTKKEPVEFEKDFSIEIENKKFIGFIDRIDKVGNEYEILDYKTSTYIEPISKMKENLQLVMYAIAGKAIYGTYPKKVSLWYLLYNKILSVDVDPEIVEKTKKILLEKISDIENKKFDATPSKLGCSFCDFKNICPYSWDK